MMGLKQLRAAAAAALMAAMLSTAAAAGGSLKDYERPYERPFSWSGIYVGGHAGAAWGDTDWTFFNGGVSEGFSQSDSSAIGGGHVGLQGQWGSFVAGVELSYSALHLKSTSAANLATNRDRTSEIDRLFLATARLGYASGLWLVYGKGGFASANVDFNTNVTSTGAPTTSSSGRETGWTIGAGVEYALTPNVILGLEYDFVRLNVGDRSQFVFPGFTTPETVTGANVDISTVMARLSYKFGSF